jgi:hypothetical protein
MKVTSHTSRASFVGVEQLPVSAEARPRTLSDEDAETIVQDALELLGDASFRQVFWDNRWLPFINSKKSLDQIWLFETSGYGLCKRRGLALERNGYVVTILVLPDPLQ